MNTSPAKHPIKTAIVGLGRAGWGMHLSELASQGNRFEVTAACDIDPTRLERFGERFPQGRTYVSLRELLRDPDVELVSIATLSPDHFRHAMAVLRAGKIAFVEKPIAMNTREANAYRTADRKYPGRLFFRHNRRFEPAFVHIGDIIASGLLGEVFEIKLRRHGYQRRRDWQTLVACGGGQLNNWGPHIVDHGLRLLESPLAAVWSDLKRVAAVGDAEDHLKIILKGRNGRIVDLEISGGAAISEPEYIVFGTRGALVCQNDQIRIKYLDPKKKLASIHASPKSPPLDAGFGNPETLSWIEKTTPVAPRNKHATVSIWAHLYAAIRERKRFPISMDEAVQVALVIAKAKQNTGFEHKVRRP